MNSNIKIDPEQYYAATTVLTNGWFPWIKSKMTIMSMMKSKNAQKIYKPIIRTAGKQTRYYLKGSTILEIIDLAEAGKLEI